MAVRERKIGGPLTRRFIREADASDPQGVRDVLAGLKDLPPGTREYVQALAAKCTEFLKTKGISADPREVVAVVEEAGYEFPSDEWYAAEIISLAHQIEGWIQAGDPWLAVKFGIRLGQAMMQLRILPHDRHRASLEHTNETRAAMRKRQAAEWQGSVCKAAERYRQRNPGLSDSRVAELIAKAGLAPGKKVGTIRKALKGCHSKKVGTDVRRCQTD